MWMIRWLKGPGDMFVVLSSDSGRVLLIAVGWSYRREQTTMCGQACQGTAVFQRETCAHMFEMMGMIIP